MRTRARKVALVAAFLVLVPAGCVSAAHLGGECARPLPGGSALVLTGTYEGPGGMAVTLSPPGKEGKAAAAVRNWPVDLADDTPETRFDGSATWDDEVADGGDELRVRLSFAPGGLRDERPAKAQYLVVGGSESEPVLLVREDPDRCGDPELERTG